jgi:Tfp pilus assembly major pilin PilA
MDKTKNTGIVAKNRVVKSRQGFALLLTLSVLSVIISLTMVLLSYFQEVQEDAGETKALIQADLYYADITSIFQRFKDKKTLFSVLYRTALPLNTPDGRFSLLLHCAPLSKGVNINWLGLENNSTNEVFQSVARELFDLLAQDYDIEDAGRLQEMLYEEIRGKNGFVFREQSRLHQKKGIISYQQFAEIISRYQFEVDDPKIGTVPWEKYFSFSPGSEKIDAQYSSPELLAYLFDMEFSTTQEWTSAIERDTLENFVETNGGDYAQRKSILAGKEFLDETECTVSYVLNAERYSFRFEYMQGEAKHFEFYGKQ